MAGDGILLLGGTVLHAVSFQPLFQVAPAIPNGLVGNFEVRQSALVSPLAQGTLLYPPEKITTLGVVYDFLFDYDFFFVHIFRAISGRNERLPRRIFSPWW